MPADMIYDPIRNQPRKRYPWERDFEYEQEEKEEEEYTPFPISPKVYHFHPIAFVEQMRRINIISAEEAKVRAYMRMLRVGEGTGEIIKSFDKKTNKVIYVANDFEKGYTTAFGGNKISDLSDHPRRNYGGSSAAGAYQVMTYTWDDTNLSLKREKHNINSFRKESQDKFCIVLMKYHAGCSEFIDLIIKGDIENATRKCGSRIWASLPCKGDNSRYKFEGKLQPATPMKDVLEHFEKFYNDELEGKTNIHLKYGFLNEFGYDY